MGIINRMRRQTAVYWPPDGKDRHGQPRYGTPVELRVRWEDDAVIQQRNGVENRKEFFTRVFVDSTPAIGGVLWYGTIATIQDTEDPLKNPGAFKIARFSTIPNLRATEVLRIATG